MPQSDRLTLSVSQLNGYVRSLLQADSLLRGLCVRGEISGFKRHVSGHLYFSLKDEGGLVRCVMFRQNAMRLPFVPRDGMRVLLTGYVSLYEAQGQYQFYGEGMERDGVGELWLRFERDRARLQAEGLFDPEKKRPLPRAPRCIGVATSPSGAVIRDIVRVAHRRNPAVDILLCPCRVQGEGAAASIAQAVQTLGAQGTKPGSPMSRRPALMGWKPSTSLSGSMARITSRSSRWRGRGSCTRMPWTAGSSFRRCTVLSSSCCVVSSGRRRTVPFMPSFLHARSLLRT